MRIINVCETADINYEDVSLFIERVSRGFGHNVYCVEVQGVSKSLDHCSMGSYSTRRIAMRVLQMVRNAYRDGLTIFKFPAEEDLTERLEESDGEMTKEEMKEYLISTGLYDDSRAATFYEERMMSSNTMVSIKDLTERFIEVDAAYGGEPWNIKQILANIRMAKSEEEKE